MKISNKKLREALEKINPKDWEKLKRGEIKVLKIGRN